MIDRPLIHLDRLTPKGTVLAGELRPGELEDLAQGLASDDGELHYRITARVDRASRRVVSCRISGFVFLTCQRTSEAFRYEVDIDDRLVLVGSEAELPPIKEEAEHEDFVVVDSPIDVRQLVAESVILALPMVPRKPGVEPAGSEARAMPGENSPFAALAGLKRSDSE